METVDRVMVDIAESTILEAPQNRNDYKAYDIYHRLSRKERQEMQKEIEKNTVKFARELDESTLPIMSINCSVLGKRRILGIIAERQARLQAQIDWLRSEREKNRR